MLKRTETTLAASKPDENDYHRALVLPEGSNIAYRPRVESPENVNSAASVYFQVGPITDHEALVRLHLFAQMVRVPIFSTLRTKEQLGYIVQSSSWTSNSMQGFRVLVQSERTAEYLERRVEALWTDTISRHLDEMTEEEFEKQKDSLINRKMERPKNLNQECVDESSGQLSATGDADPLVFDRTSRYWSEIEAGTFDFFHRESQCRCGIVGGFLLTTAFLLRRTRGGPRVRNYER